jgi:hypothetical protein
MQTPAPEAAAAPSPAAEPPREAAPPPPSAPDAAAAARSQRIERWFEVVTAVMLGVVAVATAWSGYQAARWSGEQAAHYAEASAMRVEATRDSTRGGQLRLYDLNMVNAWMAAYVEGEVELAAIFERRFRPEFQPVFRAWLALDPFENAAAPPGPLFMQQYEATLGDRSVQFEAEAASTFNRGQEDNQVSDGYVLNTVFLASVLFLTAIADRFRWNPVRAVVLALALGLLLYGLYQLASAPIV